jgi:hypothetical protein
MWSLSVDVLYQLRVAESVTAPWRVSSGYAYLVRLANERCRF